MQLKTPIQPSHACTCFVQRVNDVTKHKMDSNGIIQRYYPTVLSNGETVESVKRGPG